MDPEQVDAWVASWGGWLTGLADEAGLDAAAVTVETAPDSGYRLRNEVEMNMDPNAPAFAQAILREVVGINLTMALTAKKRRSKKVSDRSPLRFTVFRRPTHTGMAGSVAREPLTGQLPRSKIRSAPEPWRPLSSNPFRARAVIVPAEGFLPILAE